MPRPIWFAAVAAGVCALILVGVILFIRYRNLQLARGSVSELMLKADREISGGFYPAAEPYLRQAMRSAATRDAWLSIAKRAYEIASATGNYRLLLEVATEGTANLPGAQQLWAIKALAQARSGDPSDAEATARGRLTDPRYHSFGTEAILRAHPDLNISGQSISARDRQLIDILTSRNPALFENLAKEVHSRDLAFDAALLYAWKGDMKAAATLLLSQGDSAHPAAGMLINFDAGDYEAAMSYYTGIPESRRTPEYELLADDILVLEKEYDKAAASYERFIHAHPARFWMPYVDLAWLAASGLSAQISVGEATTLLEKAATLFPNQREIVLTLAALYRERGDSQAAISLLAAYLKSDPSDLDANLLSIRLSGASQNPERLSSRLWELFYQAKGADRGRIARYLTSYLLGIDDYHAAQLVFHQLKGRSDAEWIPFYRGIGDAILGNYPASVDQFEKAFAVAPQWQTLYNLAVVELRQGDAKAAVTNLEKADSILTAGSASSMKSPERAAIHVVIAEALDQMGNLQGARREVLYALDMDPNNLSAGLLLKKLDSAAQK